MAGLYTWGDWYVKAGSEQAFIEAWREFGEWTAANVPGNTFAKLLQDDADPLQFISFGPGVTRARWQRGVSTQGSRIGSGALQELLESFVSSTMTLAAEIGPPTPDLW